MVPPKLLIYPLVVIKLSTSESYEGGMLTVSHNGATKTFDLSIASDNEFHTVSFYADCDHELHQVTTKATVAMTREHMTNQLR
jgi:hypothetical protein